MSAQSGRTFYRVALGSQYDDEIVTLLALGRLSTTHIAKQIQVDDGALTIRLWQLAKIATSGNVDAALIQICGADGSTPVWELTDAGRTRSRAIRGR